MHKPAFLISFLLFVSGVIAQNSVRFEITSYPDYPSQGTDMYVAGSFNGWNPKDEHYRFKKDDNDKYILAFRLNPGTYEYKITRGGWDKVECKKNGISAANRSLKVDGDVRVELDIEEWQDRFPPKQRVSTAGKNVHIIDSAFYIPQLDRTRRIWIYLPGDYALSKKCYPVLYMQDGQNVFDDATSYAGEWGVDEFLDSTRARSCIVVAVDNGVNKRLNEYCPYDFSLTGIAAGYNSNKGEGSLYIDFLVRTLKPFIDKKYRTLKGKSNTIVAGSSMGGLISMYAVLKYPKVFGGAGVFSPAFWVGPAIFDDIKAKGKKVRSRIFFYAGKQESESMVTDMLKAFDGMEAVSKSKMLSLIRDEGKHNEQTWRKEFPLFYEWIIR